MNILKSFKDEVLVPIHPAGWPFIFLFVLVSAAVSYFWTVFILPGILLSTWCVYFFRNPKRTTPITDYLVVSPADGRILSTGVSPVPEDLDLPAGEWRRISIFMNVFDVHVNRSPVAGKVVATAYHKGMFLNASLNKASEQNERQNMVVEMASGQKIGVVQIAGLVARRIVCESNKDQELKQGDRIGMIRFGSRADVYYENYEPLVKVGQRAISGETLLAKK